MAKNSFPYKKSQGLSVNTIIIAAIALIVLVVLIAIFTGRFGIFSKSLDEIGNICKLPGTNRECCSTGNTLPDPPGGKWSDCGDLKHCCSSSSSGGVVVSSPSPDSKILRVDLKPENE